MPEISMSDLIIQIVNFKTKKYLPDCLDSIIKDLDNSNLSYKIFVLDNASGDDLEDLKNKYNITTFYSEKNLGFGAGHNLLAVETRSRYILVLNPDIVLLEKGTIKNLIGLLARNKKAKVIGPKLVTVDRKVQKWDHGESRGFLAWLADNAGGSFWKEQHRISEVAWVSGAFFMIERRVFEEVGGFDENFFLYMEEEDLCLRLRKLGYKIIYDPAVKVLHYGSVVASKSKFMAVSRDYFLKKHFKNKFRYPFLNFIYKILKKD